jgi:hypothetical protein
MCERGQPQGFDSWGDLGTPAARYIGIDDR